MNIEDKREREKRIVTQMIALYCRKKHGGKALCRQCRELAEYARSRSDKCPFMENKTFCSNCRVHCYKPEMREKNTRGHALFGTENDISSPDNGNTARYRS